MHKTLFNCLMLFALAAVCTSTAYAQKPKATDGAAKPTPEKKDTAKKESATKGAQPKASPGWVIVEDDWWVPFRYDFATALHNARVNYLNREERAAAKEIDKAVAWLKFAENVGDKRTQEDLATARGDLDDFSEAFKRGDKVEAKEFDAAFARASAALAKHHYFQASKTIGDDDLQAAGQHLQAAVDHLRDAAHAANYEYGTEIVDIYDAYAPYGYWDETISFEQSQLEMNLKTIGDELAKLSAKLEGKK